MPLFCKLVKTVVEAKRNTVTKEELEQVQQKNRFSDVILYSNVEWGHRYTIIVFTALLEHSHRGWLNEALENRHVVDHLKDTVLPNIIHWGYKRLFAEKEDTYLVHSDFKDQEETSTIFLQFFNSVIPFKRSYRSNLKEMLQSSLPELFIFLCAHLKCQSEEIRQKRELFSCYWTSESSLKLASNLLDEVQDLFDCENMSCLLSKTYSLNSVCDESMAAEGCEQDEIQHVRYLRVVLNKMMPHLTRTSWCRNPVMKYVFWIVLQNIEGPMQKGAACIPGMNADNTSLHVSLDTQSQHISDHLHYLLPPSLLFLDHHVTENKILGVECLLCIMETCSKEELRWYGRADVMYEAIKQQLYTNEAELIKVTHPAILKILEITERNVTKIYDGENRCSVRHDDILKMILFSIEGENRIELRRVMTQHLWLFIQRMGIAIVKHMKHLIRVITAYLEIYDGPEEICRFNVLKALNQLIRVAWPRIFRFEEILLKSLVKLVYDITCESSNTPSDIVTDLTEEVVRCLVLLKLASKGNVVAMLDRLMQMSEFAICHEMIDTVLKASVPN